MQEYLSAMRKSIHQPPQPTTAWAVFYPMFVTVFVIVVFYNLVADQTSDKTYSDRARVLIKPLGADDPTNDAAPRDMLFIPRITAKSLLLPKKF